MSMNLDTHEEKCAQSLVRRAIAKAIRDISDGPCLKVQPNSDDHQYSLFNLPVEDNLPTGREAITLVSNTGDAIVFTTVRNGARTITEHSISELALAYLQMEGDHSKP